MAIKKYYDTDCNLGLLDGKTVAVLVRGDREVNDIKLKNLLNATLQGLLRRNWLAPGALVCAEIEKDAAVAAPDSLELLVERHFGQTRILIWTLA